MVDRTRALRIRLRKCLLLCSAMLAAFVVALGCRPSRSGSGAPALVIDDYAEIPASVTVRLAVADTDGKVSGIYSADSSGAFNERIPAGGSGTLIVQRAGYAGLELFEWVRPPVETIHFKFAGPLGPTPVPSSAATTYRVDVSMIPAGSIQLNVVGRCGIESSVSSNTAGVLNGNGILVHDLRCASTDPAWLVAYALDTAYRPTAWGEAVGLSASPGATVPASIPLNRSIGISSETMENNVADCTVVSQITATDGTIVARESTTGSGQVSLRTFDGFAGTADLETSCPTATGVVFSRVSPLPASPTFDVSSFPAFGPIAALGTRVWWHLGAPFGGVGYIRAEWAIPGTILTNGTLFAWVPPDQETLIIPSLPTVPNAPADGGTFSYLSASFVDSSGLTYAEAVDTRWLGELQKSTFRAVGAEGP